ncbi:MAG: energy transducer TonB [Desulfonauticus sp.]|nr:energy transducer TonB [Desulfonauticus sp.]
MKIISFLLSCILNLIFIGSVFLSISSNNLRFHKRIIYNVQLVNLQKVKKIVKSEQTKKKIVQKTYTKIQTSPKSVSKPEAIAVTKKISPKKTSKKKKKIENTKKFTQKDIRKLLAQIKQQTDSVAKENELKEQALKEIKAAVQRGADKGSASLGEVYAQICKAKIQSNWRFPVLRFGEHLVAIVKIEFDAEGHIVRADIEKTSGNSLFDASCLKAIQATKQLPPPPSALQERIIFITFDSEELQ